jgi:serine O-acetyltransferase
MFHNFKEDIRIFWAKQPGGIAKLLYYPDIRVVALFRLSQWCYRHYLRPVAYFITNLNDFLHGVWIGPRVRAGVGLSLGHPRGIVINPETVIGRYVTIINQVTIGGPSVQIGDFVEIGAGAKIISKRNQPVIIGAYSIIGAGAVVTRSVPEYSVVAGVPARVIRKNDPNRWLEEHKYYRDCL